MLAALLVVGTMYGTYVRRNESTDITVSTSYKYRYVLTYKYITWYKYLLLERVTLKYQVQYNSHLRYSCRTL
jgi:hypothetical protein